MNTDLRQSEEYQKFQRQLGWMVKDVGGGQVAYVKRLQFPPLMSIVKIQRVIWPIDFSMIYQIARWHRTLFVKLEPKAIVDTEEAEQWEKELAEHGYSWDNTPYTPTKTLVMDLRLPEEELLAQMKSKTRYNIGLSQRRGMKAKVVDGSVVAANNNFIDEFYQVFDDNSRRIGIPTFPRRWFEAMVKSFEINSFIVYASLKNGGPGAVGQFLVAGDTVVYAHNGTTDDGRRNFGANLVMWEGILEGKRRGCRWLDFDGLYDERSKGTEDWKGFGRFKVGFGGKEVTYLGTYTKWLPFLKK